jgi:hypothetical protein
MQTAYSIAQTLGLPIHLSTGLVCVIPSVRRAGAAFHFQNPSECLMDCPGASSIDCDPRDTPHSLSVDSWTQALQTILRDIGIDDIVIVVAHRESIRGVAGVSLPVPYCCIAAFDLFLLQGPSH